jgi:hypothetical protein
MNPSVGAAQSSSPLPSGFHVHDECDGYVLATFSNVVVIFWKQSPSPAILDRIEPEYRKCCQNLKKGFGLMAVALTNKAPDNAREVNTRSGAIVRQSGTIAAAYLFTEEGIVGTLIKLSLNITFMLSGINQKGFSRVGDACEWLCGEMKKSNALEATPKELAEALTKAVALLKK